MPEIEFKENSATASEISDHLRACDERFYSALEERVQINAYIQKIIGKSFRHEAWIGSDLVGLVAVYYNDDSSGFDFITNVSVRKDRLGRGIAASLLGACIQKARASQAAELRLEFRSDNEYARSLYRKLGFTKYDEDQGMEKYSLILRKS